jgi:hypothetical protein
MAAIIQRKVFTHVKGETLPKTVTLDAPVGAGRTLVLLGAGGALISGVGFQKRTTYGGGAQDVSVADMATVGGETSVQFNLNGQENVSGEVIEVSGLGAYIGASTNAGGAVPAAASDYRAQPTAVGVSGNAVGFAIFSEAADATRPFSNPVNRWRNLGPFGRLLDQGANQPGADAQFIWAAGVADLTATASYPANLAAGQYQFTSQFVNPGSTAFAAQAFYANAGALINPAPANPIVRENSLPGTHNSSWFGGASATNATIAGYTDKASYAPGDTVNFKVDSTGNPFRVEIYRLGYYGWETLGARNVLGNGAGHLVGTIQAQSAPTVDGTYGSTSCAWTTNATWTIPADACSGVYYVLFRRTDNTVHFSSGHFVVRGSTTGKTAVVVPDSTYQAYNAWGATTDNGGYGATVTGRSLYRYGPDGATANFNHRAYAVSFDRPYNTQAGNPNSYLFDADQPWICFAEAQGYDLAYLSDTDLEIDSTRLGAPGLVVMMGHAEYWTTRIYDAFTAAVDAGINLFVYGANIALWRTRYAVGDTTRRTMICYKESGTKDSGAGWAGTGYDPVSYTGTWRDVRTVPGEVNNPDIRRENALLGQIFRVSGPINARTASVPFASQGKPIWRNSAPVQTLTVGQSYATAVDVIGDELDLPDGSAGQPANLVMLNPHTQASFPSGANANGSTYVGVTGSVVASATLYRRGSGALVFHTGSWRFWWGCSRWAKTELGGAQGVINVAWQNALLAILYDLGAVPASLRAMQPGNDTAPTDPSVGAPVGNRNAIATAYGLQIPAASSGGFLAFFV